MKRLSEELVVHGVLLVFMAVLFWDSTTFAHMNIGGQLGAAWWPQIVLGLGMLLTVLSAAQVSRETLREGNGAGIVKASELRALVVSSVIFAAAIVLMGFVGFLGAVPLLMFGFCFQLGSRKWTIMIVVSLMLSPIFAYVFGNFMEVPLPRGVGLARILSFYVY